VKVAEIILAESQVEEGWKSKLGGAALSAAMGLGTLGTMGAFDKHQPAPQQSAPQIQQAQQDTQKDPAQAYWEKITAEKDAEQAQTPTQAEPAQRPQQEKPAIKAELSRNVVGHHAPGKNDGYLIGKVQGRGIFIDANFISQNFVMDEHGILKAVVEVQGTDPQVVEYNPETNEINFGDSWQKVTPNTVSSAIASAMISY
jgi:hypothetical protein